MKVVARTLTFVALLFAILACQHTAKKNEETRKAALKKQAKVDARQEASDVDFDAFASRLRKAVAAHDVNTLASMMTLDFGYSLNPERSGDGVFQYWDENNLWPELEGILSEKFVKKGEYMVAPPQFADPSLNYDGYRAGIRRVNGSWKFAYFVNG
ncbi:MAG: hypothetical protein DLM52_05900 [Chthoniobacterales bacterium]|nr:MAG: hypothetical protein DLM52_05900 [Chthoniobacterales bacterium]